MGTTVNIPGSDEATPINVWVGNRKQGQMFGMVPDGIEAYLTTTAASNVVSGFTFVKNGTREGRSVNDVGKILYIPNAGANFAWIAWPAPLVCRIADVNSSGNALISALNGSSLTASSSVSNQEAYFGTDNSTSATSTDSRGGTNALQLALDRSRRIDILNPKSLMSPPTPAIYCFSKGVVDVNCSSNIRGDSPENTKIVCMDDTAPFITYAQRTMVSPVDDAKASLTGLEIIAKYGVVSGRSSTINTIWDNLAGCSTDAYNTQFLFEHLLLKWFHQPQMDPDWRNGIPSNADQGTWIAKVFTCFGALLHFGYRTHTVTLNNVQCWFGGIGAWLDGASSVTFNTSRFCYNALHAVNHLIPGGTGGNPVNEGDTNIFQGGCKFEEPGHCAIFNNYDIRVRDSFFEDIWDAANPPAPLVPRADNGGMLYRSRGAGRSAVITGCEISGYEVSANRMPQISIESRDSDRFTDNFFGQYMFPIGVEVLMDQYVLGNPMPLFSNNAGIDPDYARNFAFTDSNGNYLAPVTGPLPVRVKDFDQYRWNIHNCGMNDSAGNATFDNHFVCQLAPGASTYTSRPSNGLVLIRMCMKNANTKYYRLRMTAMQYGSSAPSYTFNLFSTITTVTHTVAAADVYGATGFAPAGKMGYTARCFYTSTGKEVWSNLFPASRGPFAGEYNDTYSGAMFFNAGDVGQAVTIVYLNSASQSIPVVTTGFNAATFTRVEIPFVAASAPYGDQYAKFRQFQLMIDTTTMILDASTEGGVELIEQANGEVSKGIYIPVPDSSGNYVLVPQLGNIQQVVASTPIPSINIKPPVDALAAGERFAVQILPSGSAALTWDPAFQQTTPIFMGQFAWTTLWFASVGNGTYMQESQS